MRTRRSTRAAATSTSLYANGGETRSTLHKPLLGYDLFFCLFVALKTLKTELQLSFCSVGNINLELPPVKRFNLHVSVIDKQRLRSINLVIIYLKHATVY